MINMPIYETTTWIMNYIQDTDLNNGIIYGHYKCQTFWIILTYSCSAGKEYSVSKLSGSG